MNRPYVKPSMLECRRHPELGLWCREDGAVFIPSGGGGPKAHWTFGCKEELGYMRVGFRGRLYYMHRLIAQTFHDNPLNLPTVDHIDRNPSNNRVDNLRFADSKMQQDNRQVCYDSLAKYGIRRCEDKSAYGRAYYAKNAVQCRARNREYYAKNAERKREYQRERRARDPDYAEHQRTYQREWYAKNSERERARQRAYMQDRLAQDSEFAKRQLTNVREWQDRQRALGRRPRKCPDGKQHWLTDEEYEARFGNNPQQIRLF